MPTIVLFMLISANMEATLMAMSSNILNLGWNIWKEHWTPPPTKATAKFTKWGTNASCNCWWWGISFMTWPDETYPRGKEASLPREAAIFNFCLSWARMVVETLLVFWLNDGEFLTEEYLLNQGTWTLLYRQQFVCIISLPLTRISMKSQLNLTQRTFPT